MSGPPGGVKMEQAAVEEEILALLQTCPEGVGDSILIGRLPGVEPRLRAQAINKLLVDAKIVLYKPKGPSKVATITGDQEEKIVFAIIEKAGNLGSWIRDIRSQSNLGQTQLNKVLKSLEGKKLIKVVKTVNATKKKVYMLYNVEPDHSVTGGARYSEQDFESEFVEILNQQCYRYLEHRLITGRERAGDSGPIAVKNASMVSPSEVSKYIGELGIVKMALKEADIEHILDTIVADGKAERSESMEGSVLYRAVVPYLESADFSRAPCGVCPVISRCGDKGSVTPATCTYFRDWLDVF